MKNLGLDGGQVRAVVADRDEIREGMFANDRHLDIAQALVELAFGLGDGVDAAGELGQEQRPGP